MQTWPIVQGMGAPVDAPSLLLTVIARWLDARKTKAEDWPAVIAVRMTVPVGMPP